MHYWNQENFEGLKSVGEKYSSISGYELFGEYCLFKEQGLKKQAVAAVMEFVAEIKTKSLSDQRKITEELSSLGYWNSDIHQLLPYPLVEYLKSILESWAADEEQNSTPHRWLGYIAGDVLSYERALDIDPGDEICITRIAQAHLNDVDYQTHHLSESLFIGEYKEAQASMEIAQDLIRRLTSQSIKDNMQEEYDYFANLLHCWQEYSSNKVDQSFPNWCASKGEEFNFWSVVYYEEK